MAKRAHKIRNRTERRKWSRMAVGNGNLYHADCRCGWHGAYWSRNDRQVSATAHLDVAPQLDHAAVLRQWERDRDRRLIGA